MNDINLKVARTFKDKSIEDIYLSESGVVYSRNSEAWSQIDDLKYSQTEFKVFCHMISESAGIALGLRTPSADAFINIGDLKLRAHVVSPPMSEETKITLRRVTQRHSDLDRFNYVGDSKEKAKKAFFNKKNILIFGATGAGKTSFLNSLLSLTSTDERVAILEDSPEIPLPNKISYKLKSRSDRFEAQEGSTWNLDRLVYESLRMRPDRIVVGELRGPEALGLVHAIESGHCGVLSTIHSSSVENASLRFHNLAALATSSTIKIGATPWDTFVHVRILKGKRYVEIFDA